MTKCLWALAAIACTGSGIGPDDGSESVASDSQTSRPGLGTLNVSATYNGASEDCQVSSDGLLLGNTGENILNVEPGHLAFGLGDPEITTLNWIPLHVTDMDEYLLGGGSTTVVANDVTPVTATLGLAPQYHCVSYQCSWPYEDGTCLNMLDSEDQWIYANSDGVLHGSETDAFGGQGGLVISIIQGVLVIESAIESTVIVESHFDPSILSIDFTMTDDAFESSASVNCSP